MLEAVVEQIDELLQLRVRFPFAHLSQPGGGLFGSVHDLGELAVAAILDVDEPELYESASLAYEPDYECSEYELEIDWDLDDQRAALGDQVNTLSFTSLHHDSSCQDESRLFMLEAWVR